jgi:hypothetical protein
MADTLFWVLVPLDAFLFSAVVILLGLHWPNKENQGKINWTGKQAWMFVIFGLVALALREILTLVEKVAQMKGMAIPPELILLDEIPALFAAIFFVIASIILFKTKK